MKKSVNNEKGFILVAAALAVFVVLGLSAVFFLRSVSEKRIVDVEKFVMQSDFLAEAGANHGLSELRNRIGSDLSSNVKNIRESATLNTYYVSGDSLGFLRDYAYTTGNGQFSVSGSEATLDLTPLSVITNVNGSYASRIKITQAAAPEKPQQEEYIFYYNYVIEGIGTSAAISPNIRKGVNLSGSFSIRVARENLAKYAIFTNHHYSASGTPVWFIGSTNFYGPVRTNEYFRFGYNPGPYFGGKVSQHNDTAEFYNDGSSIFLNDDHNGTIDVPIFANGFERGVGEVDLQSAINSDNAKYQALGGTLTEPSPSDGVYLANSGGTLTGGIYIKGTVTQLELEVDDGKPKYVIHQGTDTPTRVTINYDTNTTIVKDPSNNTTTYQGVPNGVGNEGIIIYTAGGIDQLGGTVQHDSVVTLCSENDVVITNNIMYENYNAGPPVNVTGYTNMLGLVSFNGNVRIGAAAPDNISVHGIVMAPNGQFTVDNYYSGDSRGTATLLGGAITNYYGPFGTFGGTGYGRNFVHDARVLSGQLPAYFLSMTNFASDDEGLDSRPVWQKDDSLDS